MVKHEMLAFKVYGVQEAGTVRYAAHIYELPDLDPSTPVRRGGIKISMLALRFPRYGVEN